MDTECAQTAKNAFYGRHRNKSVGKRLSAMKKGQGGDHCCRDRTRKPLWILSRQNYSAPPPACRFSKAVAGFSPVWPGSPFFGSCGSDREKTRFSHTRLITAMTLFGRNRLSSRLSLSVMPMEDPGKPGVPGRLAGDNRPPFPPNHSRQRQHLFRFVLFSFEGSRGVTPKPGEQDPVSTQSGTSQAKSPNRRKTIGFSRACEAHSFAPGPDISLWCKVTRKTMLVLSSLRKDPLRLFGENKVQSR